MEHYEGEKGAGPDRNLTHFRIENKTTHWTAGKAGEAGLKQAGWGKGMDIGRGVLDNDSGEKT